MRILVVRLSSLGDVVHAIPAVAALRRRYPEGQIDWLVDARYRELVELVPVVDRVIPVRTSMAAPWQLIPDVVFGLRQSSYDVALDLQGLLKSAILARLSGANRVIGFAPDQLREPMANWFYSATPDIGEQGHVIEKNLALAAVLGARHDSGAREFPLSTGASEAAGVAERVGLDRDERFVLINPGAAWDSKCWSPERFGELAGRLRADHGLRSVVTWGPGEDPRARAVVAASSGAALMSPASSVTDLLSFARSASVMVSGDTGPLHLAAAVQTPVVGIYGPSDPDRNGPWAEADIVVSRYDSCTCQRARSGPAGVVVRRCVQMPPCLDAISVDDVADAVARRLRAAADA